MNMIDAESFTCRPTLRYFTTLIILLILIGHSEAKITPSESKPLQRLLVSLNGRYLMTEDGNPFFWLGDTSWRLMQNAALVDEFNQPSVEQYFAVRNAQGFNVLQTVVVADGQVVNSNGHPAFADGDFTHPRIVAGPANDYWDQCDAILDLAQAYRFYVALLPVWLNNVGKNHPLVRTPMTAYHYGRFLGRRYRHRTNIIWVLGGDPYRDGHNVDQPERLRMIRAMAEGIADGTSGGGSYDNRADWSSTLMSFHPEGWGHSSSEYLHAEPWLDFNMIQTTTCFNFANYETITADIVKTPVKPTIDAEVAYEYSWSLRKGESRQKRIGPWEVRRAAYWSVFAGAFGHSYGHRSLILWTRRGERNKFGADVPWFEVLDSPGALQMKNLYRLMVSVGFPSFLPCQDIISGTPGTGVDHTQAILASGGKNALVYMPTGKSVEIHMERLIGSRVEVFWFNPRKGTICSAGWAEISGTRRFTPPTCGEGEDWVLILRSNSSPRLSLPILCEPN